jgi:hypothetical protein
MIGTLDVMRAARSAAASSGACSSTGSVMREFFGTV